MTSYGIGDTVYDKAGGSYEFLGVGFVDDTHYYRRKLDGFIFKSPTPGEYTSTPVPAKGQIWHYKYYPGGSSVPTRRHVLSVSDGFVVYEWYEGDDTSFGALSVRPVEDFLRGCKLG